MVTAGMLGCGLVSEVLPDCDSGGRPPRTITAAAPVASARRTCVHHWDYVARGMCGRQYRGKCNVLTGHILSGGGQLQAMRTSTVVGHVR